MLFRVAKFLREKDYHLEQHFTPALLLCVHFAPPHLNVIQGILMTLQPRLAAIIRLCGMGSSFSVFLNPYKSVIDLDDRLATLSLQ